MGIDHINPYKFYTINCYNSVVTNMETVWNLEIMSHKFNVDRICALVISFLKKKIIIIIFKIQIIKEYLLNYDLII